MPCLAKCFNEILNLLSSAFRFYPIYLVVVSHLTRWKLSVLIKTKLRKICQSKWYFFKILSSYFFQKSCPFMKKFESQYYQLTFWHFNQKFKKKSYVDPVFVTVGIFLLFQSENHSQKILCPAHQPHFQKVWFTDWVRISIKAFYVILKKITL